MNTTRTINLAGMAFVIDDNAYLVLHDYLDSVERNLDSISDRDEVMRDIESRLAELLTQLLRQKHQTVISKDMVHAVISQLGSPDDFKSATNDTDESLGEKTSNYAKNLFSRRLYRDTNNQVLGGVCAGLAQWLHIDPIWIRLAFVLLAFIYGITLLVYLILWAVMPEAKTASQHLEMRGEAANIENIEQEVERRRNTSASQRSPITNFLVFCVKAVLWVIAGCMLFVVGMVLFGVLSGLFGAFTGLMVASPFGIISVFYENNAWLTILLALLLVIVICLPVFALIRAIIIYARNGEHITPREIWISFVVWILALFGSMGIGIFQIVSNPDSLGNFSQANKYWQWMAEDDSDAKEETMNISTEPFHSVEVNGAADIMLINTTAEPYLEVTSKAMAQFNTEVNDSVLTITTSKKGETVKIFAKQLRTLIINGAANVENNDIYVADMLTIESYGAANIDLNVDANSLYVDGSGASEIELHGNADTLNVNIAGAGKVKAKALKAHIAHVSAAGASKIEIAVTDSLYASSYGMSKILYYGDPVLVADTNGGGKIKQKK